MGFFSKLVKRGAEPETQDRVEAPGTVMVSDGPGGDNAPKPGQPVPKSTGDAAA